MLPEDRTADETLFPEGQTDVNEQQVDLRTVNSWLLRMHEVSTPELAEVFAINALAPFILNSKLKSLMAATAPGEYKFIVNVSAMEGKFYRHKSPNHPHTNMAKAALNMMTRTSAADYAESKIYMTAVDTGWINDGVCVCVRARALARLVHAQCTVVTHCAVVPHALVVLRRTPTNVLRCLSTPLHVQQHTYCKATMSVAQHTFAVAARNTHSRRQHGTHLHTAEQLQQLRQRQPQRISSPPLVPFGKLIEEAAQEVA